MLGTERTTGLPKPSTRPAISRGIMDLRRIFQSLFEGHPEANFKVIFWDNSEMCFGKEIEFVVRFKSREAFKRLFTDVSLGFGEGYMDGDIEVEGDLRRLMRAGFLIEAVADQDNLKKRCLAALINMRQKNTKQYDRKHIAHHYDIGNDFYKLWLDKEMVYSCAYFTTEEDTLEEAQQQKMELCCKKLALKSGERLLDIGCGWGGLLLKAAQKYGIKGLGITLSRPQAAFGQQRIKDAGLSDRVKIQYLDYRELPKLGKGFDKIVSVGMFEHVGKKNIQEYFSLVRKVLNPGGLFLLHTIGKVVDQPTDSWLKKYIFPGCYIPGLPELFRAAFNSRFKFIDLEDLRIHYGRTLDEWHERFENHTTEIKKMVDDRFVRMWRFYLASCSASFWYGNMHVFQLLFSAGARNDLPLTRTWMSLSW